MTKDDEGNCSNKYKNTKKAIIRETKILKKKKIDY